MLDVPLAVVQISANKNSAKHHIPEALLYPRRRDPASSLICNEGGDLSIFSCNRCLRTSLIGNQRQHLGVAEDPVPTQSRPIGMYE